ncbi:molecular chaperone OsmY, partial [Bacillus thuringiensis]|nr:molecular chaperone OsmY [Bacillus thuringiensis]
MIRLKNVNMLLVFFLGLVVLNVLVEMEKIMVDSVKLVVSNVGEVVDNLINKVGDFMDDSI